MLCWELTLCRDFGMRIFPLRGGFLAPTSADSNDTSRFNVMSQDYFQIESLRLALTSCAWCSQLNSNFPELELIYFSAKIHFLGSISNDT